MDLFSQKTDDLTPLPEKMRPLGIGGYQFDDLGESKRLFESWSKGKYFSFVIYGPPGIGKSTLMGILYNVFEGAKYKINAVDSNVAKLREVAREAEEKKNFNGESTLLLIDEAHRLRSAQQDALLPSLESGALILAGATTENPLFTFGCAFLSRLSKVRIKSLSDEAAEFLIKESLGVLSVPDTLSANFKRALIESASGDGRKLISSIQSLHQLFWSSETEVFDEEGALKYLSFESSKSSKSLRSDALSALIKTMRASDEKAAIYYLGLLLKAKEDPILIFRRLYIFCSEDVGLADPQAIVIINALGVGFEKTGLPEGFYALYQAVSYLALAKKSRKHAQQIKWTAENLVENPESVEIPKHLTIKGGSGKFEVSNLPNHMSEN